MPDVFKLPSFHLKPGCLRSRASVSLSASYLGKMWFIDRMVWIYQDMEKASPEYNESWI